jgi:hypothetical protein
VPSGDRFGTREVEALTSRVLLGRIAAVIVTLTLWDGDELGTTGSMLAPSVSRTFGLDRGPD